VACNGQVDAAAGFLVHGQDGVRVIRFQGITPLVLGVVWSNIYVNYFHEIVSGNYFRKKVTLGIKVLG